MIKAILFDLDGTLLDTNELILTSFREAFKNVLNIEPPDDEIARLFGKPLVQSLIPYTEDKLDELVTTYRALNEVKHDTMCYAFPEVKDMLSELKGMGIKLGIVTSKRKVMADRGLKIAGIYDFLDVVITPEATEKHKPDPQPALEACRLLGVNPNEAIMVGDATFDIMCGRDAGCKTIGVKYTVVPLEELISSNPDYLIDNPMEIIEIVKGLEKKIV